MDAKGGARINVPSMVGVGHCWTCWGWRKKKKLGVFRYFVSGGPLKKFKCSPVSPRSLCPWVAVMLPL